MATSLFDNIVQRDAPLIVASGDVIAPPTLLWLDATTWGGQAYAVGRPTGPTIFWPGSTTTVEDDPFILDSDYLADLGANPNTVLWTNAARCPQIISTLLIIGV